jgi:hypothetical protein
MVPYNGAAHGHDRKPAGIHAQKIPSTPGAWDGLYWVAKPGEVPSPMGNLAAEAATIGYKRDETPTDPFMGYYFLDLTVQGSAALGGASYIVSGEMTGGFALIAYPAKYGYSAVMTFMVEQIGVVYQKDLGKDTDKVARTIMAYDPDKTWTKVRAERCVPN